MNKFLHYKNKQIRPLVRIMNTGGKVSAQHSLSPEKSDYAQ